MYTVRALPWLSIAVSLLAGLFAGSSIAMIPLTLNYHAVLSDCGRITGNGASFARDCEAFPQCVAYAPTATVGHDSAHPLCVHRDMLSRTPDGTCRNQSWSKAGCGADGAPCAWDADESECRHLPGWTPFDVSIFATSTFAGGTATSLLGHLALSTIFKGSLPMAGATTGLVGVVGTVITVAGWCSNAAGSRNFGVFWVVIAGRIVVGAAAGVSSVYGPLYGASIAPPEHRTLISGLFGPGMAVANAFSCFVSLALDPKHLPPASAQSLYAALSSIQLLLGLAFAVVCAAGRWQWKACSAAGGGEASTLLNSESQPSAGDLGEAQGGAAYREVNDEDHPPLAPATAAGRLMVGLALSAALQFTGISAVMSFAPRLAKSAGFSPLLGNTLLMTWNAITVCAATPLVNRFTCRQLFLVSATVSSFACVATGIPTLLSVGASGSAVSATHAFIIIGVMAIIGGFELGMGPRYYALAQSVFPAGAERSRGAAFTVGTQYVFTLIVGLAYAPVESLLSGNGSHGSSGSQRRGQGWIFVAFGAIGLATTLVLYRYLHPRTLASAV